MTDFLSVLAPFFCQIILYNFCIYYYYRVAHVKKIIIFLLILSILKIMGQEIMLADPYLEARIRHELRIPIGPLHKEALLQLTSLEARGCGIKSLEGIENLTNLRYLNLRDNRIQDISPLSSLEQLKKLHLRNNHIEDITPLSDLVNLRQLSLRNNRIQNIEAIGNILLLEDLSIHSNSVIDISVLENITRLRELTLRNNKIKDISVLSSLSNLKNLNIRDNQITDFSPLQNLPDISGQGSRLHVGGNHSTNFTAMSQYYEHIEDVDFIILPVVEERNLPLLINEFMATNGISLSDEEGNFPPWLELYNATNHSIDLTGYYLSDQVDNPLRWRFPDVSATSSPHMNILFPGEYLVVFASGKDMVGEKHHTNFRINREGEPLILTAPDGKTTIDFIPALPLQRDQSYGRQKKNRDLWRRYGGFFNIEYGGTTPGFSNDYGTQKIQPPVFSLSPGFYTENVNLTISHPDPAVTVLYTLDGSSPDIDNLDNKGKEYLINYFFFDEWEVSQNIPRLNNTYVYENSLEITNRSEENNDLSNIITTYRGVEDEPYWGPPADNIFKGTVVRAKAYKVNTDGSFASDIASGSYFIDPAGENRYSLPIASFITDPQNLFGYEKGIYVPGEQYFLEGGTESQNVTHAGNFGQTGREWERPVHFELFEDNGTHSLSQNVGMRIHGGFGRMRAQKAFRLYARDEYDGLNGKDDMLYQFFPDSTKPGSSEPLKKFKRILFRQGGNWYNFLNDSLAHLIMENTEVGVQRCRRFLHFINGEYWGLINVRDRLDEYHLAYNYETDPDNIIILRGPDAPDLSIGSYKLEAGLPEDVLFYNQFHSFALENDLNIPENFEKLEQKVCINSYIDYLVMFLYFGNVDWYGHRHFRYWRVRETSDEPYHDGKWRIMVWDFDNAARSYEYDLLANALDPHGEGDRYSFRRGARTELLRNMLESNTFRYLFINRFADHINTTFSSDRIKPIIEHEYAILEREMDEHRQRWNRSVANQFYLNRWLEFADKRPAYQRQHLKKHFNLEEEVTITLHVNSMEKGYIRINTVKLHPETQGVTESPYPWSGIYFKEIPVELEAIPRPGYRFVSWQGTEKEDVKISLTLSEDREITALFETDSENPIINIPDYYLRHEIYRLLDKKTDEPVLLSDMNSLEVLDLRNYAVRNLEGLQYATNLQELNLRNNGINNTILQNMQFHLLADLDKLWYLSLRDNLLTEIGYNTPIRYLKELTFLSIRNNYLQDITGLQYLSKLQNLNARYNMITDISPLTTLNHLKERLYLEGNTDLWNLTPLLPQYFEIEEVDFTILHPSPYPLKEGEFLFDSWCSSNPGGYFPDHMLFLQSRMDDPMLLDEMNDPYYVYPNQYHADDQDKIGFPYQLTGRTRINGLSEEGISFINTSRGRDLGAAVLALDTRGTRNIQVSWTGGTIIPNSRVYHIRLQARVGHNGDFENILIDGEPVEYQRSSLAGDEQHFEPFRLPACYEDKPYIQLRWKYYFTGQRLTDQHGRRDQLRLDNILVTGQPRTHSKHWHLFH